MSVVMRRAALIAALMLAPLSARAATYVLVCGPSSCTAPDGTTQAAGTALGRIVWDGTTPYTTPAGEQAVPYTNQTIYQPVVPHPTSITSAAFLARFTAAEQAAVQAAAAAQPGTIGVGLTIGMVEGTVNLSGCPTACQNTQLKTWMDGLVTAGAITSARESVILTP